jgi:hypothetical protein
MPGISILSSSPMKCLFRAVGFMISADKGSWTQLFAVAGRDFTTEMSGGYLDPIAQKSKITMPRNAPDDLGERLWKWTEEEMKAKGYIG